MLQTIGLTKTFGGFTAVDHVDFNMTEGELRSIIGPNGAGKTTFFNLITGGLRSDAGKVYFRGEDITNMSPHQIARLGIGRGFQVASNFPRLTVFENLLGTLITAKKRNLVLFSDARSHPDTKEEAYEILKLVGLSERADITAGALAQPDKKRLDIAIAIAPKPKLVLLDEPTSGMSIEDVANLTELIRRLRDEQRFSTLFIEHNMRVAFSISDRITVFHMGKIIADDKPEIVKGNKEVIEAYLGSEV